MMHAVIMAGGRGTRFWPASRENKPKQLLNIYGDRTMIRATVERILPEIPFERIMVVTAASHAEEIRKQLPELSPEKIVVEPVGRNTAACTALAAYKLIKTDPAAVMAMLPADHLIRKKAEFLQALKAAYEAASVEECLVTFGIVPARPETGYGYIKVGPPALRVHSATAFHVDRFVEKPDFETACKYLASGDYLWNSGMFIWQAKAILREFETHLASLNSTLANILPALNTDDEPAAIAAAYNCIESISIDNGILEKAKNVLTIPIDVDWDDVGSWASLGNVWDQDEFGNVTKGPVAILDGRGCIVSSPDKVATMIGVEDMIVVDTPDALLVCRKDRAQDVKKLHELLKEKGYEGLL
jgi:mannose-1-phosphate guanylyltransferase